MSKGPQKWGELAPHHSNPKHKVQLEAGSKWVWGKSPRWPQKKVTTRKSPDLRQTVGFSPSDFKTNCRMRWSKISCLVEFHQEPRADPSTKAQQGQRKKREVQIHRGIFMETVSLQQPVKSGWVTFSTNNFRLQSEQSLLKWGVEWR